ncbi:MAG: ABC transporter [Candidatus Dactylopiibacterium carminicum]|uniref:ABC transporter n=1 Tax=Candidatus Dactylopiibacterium carminicum TaxID=857335 RepID=A0A272ES87_9RHOO|nr:zinc ABC transporter ATP-binding protein AztA [Candidatus Dactylopiibacterium carminicum]KAF7600680.1 ABC transporter ATP-binding protein [Candidatus Dactylopiibacterium carminicum]PAS92983.1 MAG: ABC transporter [Candidatus Dactylopiibacterium carminicum]PAS96531.1 MAG: ABC transporter [Candidatus Dactylopiibacterium carminicum]PAT00682.1 MAG: ABC transporter [Candidatus Dactylopiibacterium carminicum]
MSVVCGPAIRLENLTLGYERHPVVHHVSLEIPAGGLVAVVGPNGAGKSTLVKALAGLKKPLQGQVHGLRGQRVAYLPQHAEMDRSFPINVLDMVAFGLWHETGALGGLDRAQRERCHHALESVGLQGFAGRTIDTLSGGQFQRALFARLLLQDAPVILLDEPFTAIDARTTEDLLKLLHRWHAEGRTVLAVLHDLAQARAHFSHAMLLARELIAWGAPAEVLGPGNLARSMGMHEAFDDEAPPCEVPEGPAATVQAHDHRHGHAHGHVHAGEEV